MLTVERIEQWRRDAATQRGFLAASLHLYVIVPGSDSDKNAKKMRVLFIPGQNLESCPRKIEENWRKLWDVIQLYCVIMSS